jgi:hypothetical protein
VIVRFVTVIFCKDVVVSFMVAYTKNIPPTPCHAHSSIAKINYQAIE